MTSFGCRHRDRANDRGAQRRTLRLHNSDGTTRSELTRFFQERRLNARHCHLSVAELFLGFDLCPQLSPTVASRYSRHWRTHLLRARPFRGSGLFARHSDTFASSAVKRALAVSRVSLASTNALSAAECGTGLGRLQRDCWAGLRGKRLIMKSSTTPTRLTITMDHRWPIGTGLFIGPCLTALN